jgi:hypothetical protein
MLMRVKVFDPVEGYTITREGEHVCFTGRKSFSDFHTKERHADGRHCSFLITQYKSIGKQGWKSSLDLLTRRIEVPCRHRHCICICGEHSF